MIHGAAPSSLRGWRTVSSELRWKSNAAGHLQQEGKKNLQQNIVCVIRWKRGDNDSSISSNNNKKIHMPQSANKQTRGTRAIPHLNSFTPSGYDVSKDVINDGSFVYI